jgi:hypothetical protein
MVDEIIPPEDQGIARVIWNTRQFLGSVDRPSLRSAACVCKNNYYTVTTAACRSDTRLS